MRAPVPRSTETIRPWKTARMHTHAYVHNNTARTHTYTHTRTLRTHLTPYPPITHTHAFQRLHILLYYPSSNSQRGNNSCEMFFLDIRSPLFLYLCLYISSLVELIISFPLHSLTLSEPPSSFFDEIAPPSRRARAHTQLLHDAYAVGTSLAGLVPILYALGGVVEALVRLDSGGATGKTRRKSWALMFLLAIQLHSTCIPACSLTSHLTQLLCRACLWYLFALILAHRRRGHYLCHRAASNPSNVRPPRTRAIMRYLSRHWLKMWLRA